MYITKERINNELLEKMISNLFLGLPTYNKSSLKIIGVNEFFQHLRKNRNAKMMFSLLKELSVGMQVGKITEENFNTYIAFLNKPYEENIIANPIEKYEYPKYKGTKIDFDDYKDIEKDRNYLFKAGKRYLLSYELMSLIDFAIAMVVNDYQSLFLLELVDKHIRSLKEKAGENEIPYYTELLKTSFNLKHTVYLLANVVPPEFSMATPLSTSYSRHLNHTGVDRSEIMLATENRREMLKQQAWLSFSFFVDQLSPLGSRKNNKILKNIFVNYLFATLRNFQQAFVGEKIQIQLSNPIKIDFIREKDSVRFEFCEPFSHFLIEQLYTHNMEFIIDTNSYQIMDNINEKSNILLDLADFEKDNLEGAKKFKELCDYLDVWELTFFNKSDLSCNALVDMQKGLDFEVTQDLKYSDCFNTMALLGLRGFIFNDRGFNKRIDKNIAIKPIEKDVEKLVELDKLILEKSPSLIKSALSTVFSTDMDLSNAVRSIPLAKYAKKIKQIEEESKNNLPNIHYAYISRFNTVQNIVDFMSRYLLVTLNEVQEKENFVKINTINGVPRIININDVVSFDLISIATRIAYNLPKIPTYVEESQCGYEQLLFCVLYMFNKMIDEISYSQIINNKDLKETIQKSIQDAVEELDLDVDGDFNHLNDEDIESLIKKSMEGESGVILHEAIGVMLRGKDIAERELYSLLMTEYLLSLYELSNEKFHKNRIYTNGLKEKLLRSPFPKNSYLSKNIKPIVKNIDMTIGDLVDYIGFNDKDALIETLQNFKINLEDRLTLKGVAICVEHLMLNLQEKDLEGMEYYKQMEEEKEIADLKEDFINSKITDIYGEHYIPDHENVEKLKVSRYTSHSVSTITNIDQLTLINALKHYQMAFPNEKVKYFDIDHESANDFINLPRYVKEQEINNIRKHLQEPGFVVIDLSNGYYYNSYNIPSFSQRAKRTNAHLEKIEENINLLTDVVREIELKDPNSVHAKILLLVGDNNIRLLDGDIISLNSDKELYEKLLLQEFEDLANEYQMELENSEVISKMLFAFFEKQELVKHKALAYYMDLFSSYALSKYRDVEGDKAEDLIKRIEEGDSEAIETMYEIDYPLSIEDVKDVLQNHSPFKSVDSSADLNSDKLLTLKEELSKEIFNQEQAIEVISDTIMLANSGLVNLGKNKPIASFMFSGRSGTGKTEMAIQLAKKMDMNLVRLDMSEYSSDMYNSNLIGSAAGYVGSDRGGILTEAVKANPRSIVLLDEIEKAAPSIQNNFYQVLDYGILTDAKGTKIDFSKCIVIFTTNTGNTNVHKTFGLGFNQEDKEQQRREKSIENINKGFAEAIRGRLDAVILFNDLNKEVIIKVLEKEVLATLKNLEDLYQVKADFKNGLETFVNDLNEGIIERKSIEKMVGVREVKKEISNRLSKFLAIRLMQKEISQGDNITLDYDKVTDMVSFHKNIVEVEIEHKVHKKGKRTKAKKMK